jgi:hypothetical protein
MILRHADCLLHSEASAYNSCTLSHSGLSIAFADKSAVTIRNA